MSSNRLGKGLSSLLGERGSKYLSTVSNDNADLLKEIAIDLIIPNKYQPRKIFEEGEIDKLANSIREHGLLQPIVVRKCPDKEMYEIIAGERRFRASKKLNLQAVPVVIKELNDKETLTLAIIENVHRENLSPIEEAEAYKRLMKDFSYTQEQVSQTVGKSRSHIANLIRLLNLPAEIQEKVNQKLLEMGHARALINSEYAMEIAEVVVQKGLSVRETERLVRVYKNRTEADGPIESEESEGHGFFHHLKRFEKMFSDAFNLKLKTTFNPKRKKGKIVINYSSVEDLDKIINKLLK